MRATRPSATAADAINSFGIDLLPKAGASDANVLLSPYSIQSVMAMAFAGAEGGTRNEMAKVLHYPADDAELHLSFSALRHALDDAVQKSSTNADPMGRGAGVTDPILSVANGLFGQAGYDFRAPFLALVEENYGSPFEALDFVRDAAAATAHINDWVESRTRQRICDLVPANALTALTRLVLVNAIYFKAAWWQPFRVSATSAQPFHLADGTTVEVPTMMSRISVGYDRRDTFSVAAIPYVRRDLQFVVLLPEKKNGLAALEGKLTAELLANCANLPEQEVILHLPKFKFDPPAMKLGDELRSLGMQTAFDGQRGSANFDRIAPRRADDYLYISDVLHKAFLELDEAGSEATAVTRLLFNATFSAEPSPIEVRVDHPFVFAIQHRPSGACLFLGRMTNPRGQSA